MARGFFSAQDLSVNVDTTQAGAVTSVDISAASLTVAAYLSAAASTSTWAVVSTAASAATALIVIQTAISQLASDRAQVGANLSRLETERNTISILRDNLSAARSRITDVDVAEESANFARQQILVQSGTAMLAQANVIPQSALALIG